MTNPMSIESPITPTAFLEIFEKNRGIILKIARAYTQTHEDKEDLISNITLELWKTYYQFKGSSAISTWIYRVALNTSMNYQRGKHYSRLNVKLDMITEPTDVNNLGTEDPIIEELYDSIAELDEWSRALILLVLEGNSHEEIADVLGISKTNVGTQIGRIKLKLKKIIKQNENYEFRRNYRTASPVGKRGK
jgi:RNA polymerase sigma-70 factor, ECF subfamily